MAQQLLSDADLGLGAPASGGPKLFSDADLGIGAPQGALSNSGDDGWLSGAAKGAATAGVKILGNVATGGYGNVRDFGNYLGDRFEGLISGRTPDEIAARHAGIDQQMKQSDSLIGKAREALSADILPTGEDFARPILNQTGEYKPETLPGRMAQTGLEMAGSMAGPAGGARAPGTTLKQALIQTPIKMAPANVAAGATGQLATEVTDDPLIGMAAGMAAPAAGAAVTGAARRMVRPLTPAGREQMTGERLLAEASNPDKVRADLQFQPAETVPGSKPTTAQLTEDMGLLQAERRARTEDARGPDAGNTPFNVRDAEQNTARLDALDQARGQGNPLKVSDTFQQHLDTIDQATQLAIDNATQRAQSEAAKLGPAQAPDVLGQQLRDAVQSTYGNQKQIVDRLYRTVDPNGNLRAAATPLKEAGVQVAGSIDPLRKGPSEDVQRVLGNIQGLPDVVPFQSLRSIDADLSEAMSQAKRSGDNANHARLVQLKGAVKDAINNAVEHQAAWERQQVQRGALDVGDTLDARIKDFFNSVFADHGENGTASRAVPGVATPGSGGAGGTAFPAQEGRGSRTILPGISAAEAKRPPQSLMDWVAANGGLRDDGGELAARGLPAWSKGRGKGQGVINNEGGMPLDQARQNAAEAGYLGGDIDRAMSETDVGHFLDALDNGHQVHSVYDEGQLASNQSFAAARAARDADLRARSELASGLQEQGLPQPEEPILDRTVQLMNEEQLPWDNALEKAHVEAYNAGRSADVSRMDRLQSGQPEFDVFPGDLPPAAKAAPSGAQPNMTKDAANRLATANKAYGQMAETYRQGPVKGVLKTNGFADNYTVPDAGVMKRVFTSGDTGYSNVQAFLKAAGNDRGAVSAIRDYALNDLRSSVRPDGTLDPKAFQSWRQRYGQALRAVDEVSPNFSNRFANAAQASEQMMLAGAHRKQQLDTFRKTEAARFLGKSDPGEVAAQVGAVIRDGKSGPSRMQELVKQAGKSPEALEGLRSAAVDWIVQESLNAGQVATSGQRPLSNAKFQKILDQYGPTLSALMPKETMQNMRVIADDLAKSNLKVTATGNAGSPNTAKDLLAGKADEAASRHPSLLSAVLAGGASGWHFGSATIGAVTGGAWYVLGKLRAAGLGKADALFRDALLNPDRAKYYLSKVGEKGTSKAWNQLGRSLQRDLVLGPVLQQKEREGYAKGGRATPPATVAPDFMQQINSALRARLLGGVSSAVGRHQPLSGYPGKPAGPLQSVAAR